MRKSLTIHFCTRWHPRANALPCFSRRTSEADDTKRPALCHRPFRFSLSGEGSDPISVSLEPVALGELL